MSSNNQNNIPDLRKCTVGIINSDNNKVLGTGIIVTDEGYILTCYHVIKDNNTIIKNICILFPSLPSPQNRRNAKVLEQYCNSDLDVAFLQLHEELPKGIEITNLSEIVYPNRDFMGFGFRKDDDFFGLGSIGKIVMKISKKLKDNSNSPPFIQIKTNDIEKRMSGSPILDTTTNKVIGIVSERYRTSYSDDVDKYLSLGIPIETIIKVYPELQRNNPALLQDLVINNLDIILKHNQHFIDCCKSILNNIDHEKLSTAGGLLSLIIICSQIFSTIKDRGQVTEQIAFSNLVIHIFDTAREIIEKDFKDFLEIEDERVRKFNMQLQQQLKMNKEIIQDLLEMFKWHSEYNSYLPDYQSIIDFKKKIISYMNENNIGKTEIDNFIINYNISLNNRVTEDNTISKFYRWWTNNPNTETKVLVAYLEEIRADVNLIADWDRKQLQDCHRSTRAFIAEINTMEKDDEALENIKYEPKEPIKIIEDNFLEHDENDWCRIIGGTFGMGQTTLSKIIAAKIAREYLCNPNLEKGKVPDQRHNYIPIICRLNSNLQTNTISRENLYIMEFLRKICYTNKKIFLILDGLNEYPDIPESLINFIKENILSKNDKTKVIITTKVGTETLTTIKNMSLPYHSKSKYIRLLPFKKEEVDNFFKIYEVQEKITYEIAIKKFGKEIKKPLFTWMLSLIYRNLDKGIKAKEEWNEHISRALIYFYFLHHVIRTKKDIEPEEPYYKEKQILRLSAALKHIYKDKLTLDRVDNSDSKNSINKVIKKFDPSIETTNITSIINPYLSQSTGENVKINFLHETFQHYLLAEYYLEVIFNGEMHKLNMGIPNIETILFLQGLLYLIKYENDKHNILEKLFKKSKKITTTSDRIRTIINNTISSIMEDNIIFLNLNNKKENKNNPWKVAKILNKNYKNLWIHRWISLLVLNDTICHNALTEEEQKQKKEEVKEYLVEIISYSSEWGIPNYLKKLNNFDLSDTNLIEAHLSGADLSNNKNLECANFFYAKLTHANFSNTDLSLANFWRANLHHINFCNATLYGANFYLAELRGSKLISANLQYAELTGANISRANLSYADLSNANLTNANLSYADLSNANLTNANLSYADLSNTKMSNITNYNNLKCYNSNLNHIITDDKLSHYLIINSSLNIDEDNTKKISMIPHLFLTGIWRSNDGGTYYITQIGSILWSFGISNASNFANIFKGKIIDNDRIDIDWADVPLGEDLDYGNMELKIKSVSNIIFLIKIKETGGFGATIWQKIENLPAPLRKKYKIPQSFQFSSFHRNNKTDQDLTGIWRSSSDDIIYYVHQIGITVWSCGINNAGNFARVFRGEIIDNDTINVEWADVHTQDNNKLNGTMELKIQKSGNEVISFQQDNSQTSYYKIG